MKRREGDAGFYRSFRPGQRDLKNLEEAIALTKELAVVSGLLQIEVNQAATRTGPDGNYHVALYGRTQRSLDREAAETKQKEKRDEGKSRKNARTAD